MFLQSGVPLTKHRHSGVSWAVNGGAKKIRLITDWPNPESANPTSEKVPSCISYVDGKPTNWGFQVGFAEDSFKWIKILLEPNHKYRKAIEPVKISNRLLGTLKKTAVEVVADYLRFLWTYTTDDIRRRQGDDYLSIYSLRIILTVPAIWSDAAKDKTLQAARLAGLPSDITLVTEPEAAALATLRDKAETSNLKASYHKTKRTGSAWLTSLGWRCICGLRCWRRNRSMPPIINQTGTLANGFTRI
jgi:hypothetical protein